MPFSLKTSIFAAELRLVRRIDGAPTTLYVTNSVNFTVGGSPARNTFRAVMPVPAMVDRTMFDDRKTSGSGRSGVGRLELLSPEGQLDIWEQYIWQGGTYALKLGAPSQEYNTDFIDLYETTIDGATFKKTTVDIALRDWQRALEIPLQRTNFFLGDSSGLEGDEDLKDKPMPIVIGEPFNVEPIPVNRDKQISCVADDQLSAITAVKDEGVPLFGSPVVWASVAHALGWSEVLCSATNGVRIAIGGAAAGVGKIATSDNNGATWTQRTITSTNKVVGLAYGEPSGTPKWVAVTLFDGIETSPDGTTWTQQRVESGSRQSDNVRWIAQEQLFFVVGDQQRIFTSPTCASGTLTTQRNAGAGSVRVRDVAAINGYVIAVTNTGVLYRMASGVLGTQTIVTIDGAFVDWTAAHATATALYIGSAFGLLYVTRDGLAFTKRDPGLPINGGTQPTILDFHSFNGYVVASCSSGHLTFSRDEGATWRTALSGVSGDLNTIIIAADNRWISGSSAADIVRSNGSITYASSADLLNDALAPEWGNYGIYLSASGSYIRLGSPPAGRITCDPVSGATAADRTAAQSVVRIARDRADFSASPNLVTNPSALSPASGWTNNGTLVTTEAYLTRKGYSFSRMTGINGGDCARIVGLTGNAKKLCSWLIIGNGAAGFSHIGLFDNSAAAWRLRLAYTIDANGFVTAVAEVGTLVSVRNLGNGIFLVTGLSTTVTATNVNVAYGNAVSGTASSTLTSVLMSDITVKNATVQDDWLAFDVVAADAMNSGVVGYYTPAGDSVTCAQAIDEIIASPGGSVFTDSAGVLRMAILEDPENNLVSSPSLLHDAPWTGVGTYTNRFAVYDGISFSRVQGDGSTNHRYQPIGVLTGANPRVFSIKVHHNGAQGNDIAIFWDGTVNVARAALLMTFNADGTISFASAFGTFAFTVVRLPEGSYHIRMVSSAIVSGNQHYVYASDVSGALGGGGVTDWLAADLKVDELPDFTIDQAHMEGAEEIESGDDKAPAPPYSVKLKYRHNYTPMSGTDIAGSLDDETRTQLEKEWLDIATAADTAIQTLYPLSEPRVEDTLFIDSGVVTVEGLRRKGLHGVERRFMTVPVDMTDETLRIEPNHRVELASNRHRLGAGRRARVMAVNPDVQGGIVNLICWMATA